MTEHLYHIVHEVDHVLLLYGTVEVIILGLS